MHFTIRTATLLGVEAHPVDAEIDITDSPSEPAGVFVMVGLPDATVRESRQRIRAAIANTGYRFPPARVTVNLAPADLRKNGSAFDLPVAIGILVASRSLDPRPATLEATVFYGELGLDGRVRPVRGALAVAVACRQRAVSALVVAEENAGEAAVVEGIDVYPVRTLADVVALVRSLDKGQAPLPARVDGRALLGAPAAHDAPDYAEVRGQGSAKRALEIAAAGDHNVLMIGPPGSGKTMLARRLPTILPPFTFEEALEASVVHSVAGLLPLGGLVTSRPFRAPHHTISSAGLVGGGTTPRPGEVSLAHNGVLFLDELVEFDRSTLEVLRQPLEDSLVTISRAAATLTYPARFTLVGALNPCPCGRWGDPTGACRCTLGQVQRYLGRVSGPLLDRMDIQIEVPAVKLSELSAKGVGERSDRIRARVVAARERQTARFLRSGHRGVRSNGQMTPPLIRAHCALEGEIERRLEARVTRMGLSARAYHRILKVARTIADLADRERIEERDVAEAVRYRSLDRSYWGAA